MHGFFGQSQGNSGSYLIKLVVVSRHYTLIRLDLGGTGEEILYGARYWSREVEMEPKWA